MSTPKHCPGFEQLKNLQSFVCKCPECGTEMEIFSDEFGKPHKCRQCGKPVDFSQCAPEAGGAAAAPR